MKALAVKRKLATKAILWEKIENWSRKAPIPVFIGLKEDYLAEHVRTGSDFLYLDNSYFFRGSGHFRLIRGALHLTRLLPAQKRIIRVPELEPWRKTGRKVVVIPPSPYHVEIYQAHDWLKTTLDTLSRVTARPVVVKEIKGALREFLDDAFAVVTFASVAGVEAATWGIPVFAGPYCPCLPISAGPVEQIETPYYASREIWRRSLAYADWTMDQINQINIKDYAYA